MRTAKIYSQVTRRFFHPEVVCCPTCQNRLRRYATLSSRLVVTLKEIIRVTHCGYRCPNPACPDQTRCYRSATADMLALPGFTFGLDIVLLVGHLHLAEHQTLDEVYQSVQQRLEPMQVSISRREIFYLFEAYCHLLQVGAEVAQDRDW